MTEIAVRDQAPSAVALTSDIDSWTHIAGSVIKLANEICDTPFVPDGLRGSAPAVAAAILAGREIGVGPMTALPQIHVIKGKPALSAALMRALIQAQGHQWQDVEVTDTRAVVRARRRGEAEWSEASFTAEQARRARIDLSAYPQDKLYARATSRLARRKFADVIAGMPHSAEELEDEPGSDTAPQPARPDGRITAADITGRRAPADPSPAAHAPAPQAAAEPAGEVPPPPATGGQVGIIRKHFERLGYDPADPGHEQKRLNNTAKLAGLGDIGSTRDLDQEQAAQVIGWLQRCRDDGELERLLKSGDTPDA